MALALLVFAMEEGGETMSSFAVPLTRVIVLLSQGIGMHARGDYPDHHAFAPDTSDVL